MLVFWICLWFLEKTGNCNRTMLLLFSTLNETVCGPPVLMYLSYLYLPIWAWIWCLGCRITHMLSYPLSSTQKVHWEDFLHWSKVDCKRRTSERGCRYSRPAVSDLKSCETCRIINVFCLSKKKKKKEKKLTWERYSEVDSLDCLCWGRQSSITHVVRG